MRRNQYNSEKRRKELDRKKKQEEKRQKKLERRTQGPEDGEVVIGPDGLPVVQPQAEQDPDAQPAEDSADEAAAPGGQETPPA